MNSISNLPLISIIIPNHNGAGYIESCLKSLHAQIYERTEIVLVDNDSRELAEKIGGLLSGLQPTLESAVSIRESVRDYSWENIAAAIAAEFQRVLSLERTPVA